MLKISKRYKLFREALISYRNKSESKEVDEVLEIINRQIDNWDILLMVIIKGSMKLTEKIKDRVSRNYDILITQEELLKQAIYKMQKGVFE